MVAKDYKGGTLEQGLKLGPEPSLELSLELGLEFGLELGLEIFFVA